MYNPKEKNLEKLPEEERWSIKFIALTLKNELKEKYGKERKAVSEISICPDGRRENTVRKALLKYDLITEPAHYMNPKMETILKKAPIYATAPEFKIKGIKKTDSYIKENWKLLNTYTDAYTDIENLKQTEIIYVYLHQDEFDIQKIHYKTRLQNRYGFHEYDKIKIFPKDKVKDLRKAVYDSKILYQARKNMHDFLERAFDRKFKTIKRPNSFSFSDDKFKKKEIKDPGAFKIRHSFNKEEIEKRISSAQENIRYLNESIKELEFFKQIAHQQNIEEVIQKKANEWMTEDAPLHINSENEELKELAHAILNGKNT